VLSLKEDTMLGNVPEDWHVRPLRSLLIGNYPGDWGDDRGPHMVPVLRSTNLTNEGRLDLRDVEYRALRPDKASLLTPQKGDILLERSGGGPGQPVGRVGFVESDMPGFAFSNFLHLLRPDQTAIDNRLLGWVLYRVNRTGRILRLEQQTTQMRNLNFRDYLTMLLPVPPPDEQHCIARILDFMNSTVERTRYAWSCAVALVDCLIDDLLRFGPKKEPQRKSNAGLIPGSWHCEGLGNHIVEGPTNGLYRPESDYGNCGTPIVRIDSFDDGKIHRLSELRRVVVEEVIQARYSLRQGDVVINRVNSLSHIGKAAIVPVLDEPTIFESNMMMLRCDSQILPEFLTIVLRSDFARKHWLSRAKPAVNQASINQRDVRELWVPFPLIDEQREILEMVAKAESHANLLGESFRSQQMLKAALMQDLLVGQFQVKTVKSENAVAS